MKVKDSKDAFRLIHKSLAKWVECALESGFEDNPFLLQSEKSPGGLVGDFCRMASIMREIESHTDIEDATP